MHNTMIMYQNGSVEYSNYSFFDPKNPTSVSDPRLPPGPEFNNAFKSALFNGKVKLITVTLRNELSHEVLPYYIKIFTILLKLYASYHPDEDIARMIIGL
jgi:hypothetical protein